MSEFLPNVIESDLQLTSNQTQIFDNFALYGHTKLQTDLIQKLIDILQKTWNLKNEIEGKPQGYSLNQQLRIEQIKRLNNTIPEDVLLRSIKGEMRTMFVFENILNRLKQGAKLSENQANI
jgi:hypothetical protein